MTEAPDWLRATALIGKYGATYLPVAVDPSGQLYIVLTGAPDVTIPGTVNTNDLVTLKQIQGTDGTVFRTAKVDASGQFIMVPRGSSGNYMAVDASGFLTAILKGTKPDTSLGSIAVDASGQLIMVPRGSSGNYMDVDASGFLTAILKGLYGSTLKTIATDVGGRMIGQIADVGGGFGQTDTIGLAELAARIGGLQRWDTRGRLLISEDFDTGIHVPTTVSVVGTGTYSIDVARFESGGYSLKCILQAVAGDYVRAFLYAAMPTATTLGIETAFSQLYTYGVVEARIAHYKGTTYSEGGLRWDTPNNTIYYYNNAQGWTAIPGGTFPRADQTAFNHLKCVMDFGTGKYIRGMANNTEFNLSALSFYVHSTTARDIVIANVNASQDNVHYNEVWIDNISVTHSEPA